MHWNRNTSAKKHTSQIMCLLLVLMWGMHNPVLAQDEPDEVENRLHQLMSDDGLNIDEARDRLSDEYDDIVATAITVRACFEEEVPCDEDSTIGEAWFDFVDYVELDELSVSETIDVMLADEYYDGDGDLIHSLGLWWCIPDAGQGCGGEDYMSVWGHFERLDQSQADPYEFYAGLITQYGIDMAEFASAFWCGHVTCFADLDLEDDLVQQANAPTDRPVAVTPPPNRGQARFANNPKEPKKKMSAVEKVACIKRYRDCKKNGGQTCDKNCG